MGDILEIAECEVARLKRNLNEYKGVQQNAGRDVLKTQRALAGAMFRLETLKSMARDNKIDPKRCRHEIASLELRNGLGYSGFKCAKCRTLLVKTGYDGKLLRSYHPKHPFKPDCKHPQDMALTYADMPRETEFGGQRLRIAPLNTGGHYCIVCGASWEGKKKPKH